MGQKTVPVNSHVRASLPLALACSQGRKSQGGVLFLVLKTCCYQRCKRTKKLFRFGRSLGPDPAPGGPVFTFRTACYYRSFAKLLDFGVQIKGPVAFSILSPPRLGLADFRSHRGRAGHFVAPSNMPTLEVEAAKLQDRWCLFLDPKIKRFTQKTSGNRRSEK